jgi:hypothetical protein
MLRASIAFAVLIAACTTLATAAGAATTAPVGFATTATEPIYDTAGHLVQTPLAPAPGAAPSTTRMTSTTATAVFLQYPKVRDWVKRYKVKNRTTEATFDATAKSWKITVRNNHNGDTDDIATGNVDDATSTVTEAWTGPQVAWTMGRGYDGAFGGRLINTWWLWLALCTVFLVGLVDFRRIVSWRTLDLLVLLAFSIPLYYFNQGNVFRSVSLVYPPLVYLLVRGLWIGITGRGSAGRPVWPAIVLLAATVFLAGARVGLNWWDGNVIDVGYSGVIGAERISHGQSPYGNFPLEDDNLKPCGPKDAEGIIHERIQTNGRCERSNPQGDTYGPIAYAAYIPAYAITGWSGKWDRLPTAHLTAIFWDLLCLIGMFLVGRRFGGFALGSTLAFAWAAYPFTQYASSSNTNDMIMPAFLIWGFWLVSMPVARGVFAALAGWTKFAALIIAPLWMTYPDRRPKVRYILAFVATTLVAFSVLLLEPSPIHAARVFWDRTLGWQIGREAPWSAWDWRQYHADGIPNLHRLQNVLQALLIAGALVLPFWPRRKSPLQLAALTGALLLGFQLVLTYWIYLYIPWFFGFAAIATLAPRATPERVPEPSPALAPEPSAAPT